MSSELVGFTFECPRTWESLQATGDAAVRWCDDCAKQVWDCSTVGEARQRGQRGQCVALPTILIASRGRRLKPLASPGVKMMTLGMLGGDGGLPIVGWLVPLDGPRTGETLRLGPAIADAELSGGTSATWEGTLGGAAPADLVVPDDEIATPHARFKSTPSGFTIVDAGTDAGTYVNDRRITRFELTDNDIIRVGQTRLLFKTIV